MPSIQTASKQVTSFPNEYVSPFGNDLIIPLYSSVPLKSPVSGFLPCVVCGNSILRNEIISSASNFKTGLLYSSIVNTPSPYPNPPKAPTNVTCSFVPALNCIGGKISVSWTPPEYGGLYPIEGYRIYVDNVFVGGADSATTTQIVCANGIISTSVIQVSAFNQIGEGVKSEGVIFGHVPGFPGLVTPSTTWKYITLCDWDLCLYSEGVHDTFVADGVTYTNPNWPAGGGNPGNVVDGHMTWMCVSGGNATCIDATGGLIDRIGNHASTDDIYNSMSGTGISNVQKLQCGPGITPVGCCGGNTLNATCVVLSNTYSSSTYP